MTKMSKKGLRGRKKAMYVALKGQLGIVSAACREVGLSRETHYRWLKDDPNYKAWVDTVPDECLDFAEHALHKLINGGNVAATIFYLKTKGKHRGYIEKTEQEVNITGDNRTIQVNIPKEVQDLIKDEQ